MVEMMTPAQRRTYEELWAVGAPRPPADEGIAQRLRSALDARTAPLVATRPAGADALFLSKATLDALGCEGRYLALRDLPFAWTVATAAGTLAHRAVELDHAARRETPVDVVVRRAWEDLGGSGPAATAFCAGLDEVEAAGLRAEAESRLLEFRESFPLWPPSWRVRFEVRMRVRLHDGAVTLQGRPDLVFGGVHPQRRGMLLVDLKTGQRHPRHRADLRFYALLAALKYRAAPWRIATYYLDEADWEAEDVDEALLEDALRSLVDRAEAAARLNWGVGAAGAEPPRLRPGPACGWCPAAPTCPAAAPRTPQAAARPPASRAA